MAMATFKSRDYLSAPRIRRSVLRLIEALQHAQLNIEVARAAPETAQHMEKATGKNTKPILDGKNATHKSGDDFRDGLWHGFNHIILYDDKMLEIYNDPIIEKHAYIYTHIIYILWETSVILTIFKYM